MTHKIFRSILIAEAVVLILGLAVSFLIMFNYSTTTQKKRLADELYYAAVTVESGGADRLAQLDPPDSRLTLIAASGKVLFDTNTDAETMEDHSGRKEFIDALADGYGEDSRFSETLAETTDYIARRLSDGSVLRISTSHASVIALALGMLRPMLVIFALAFLVSGFLASRMSKHIAAPLDSIDLDHPLDCDAYDELSPFLNRINQQNHRIAAQFAELKRQSEESQQIADNMSEGLILLDTTGKVVSMNPAAKKIFGCEDPVGRDFIEIDRDVKMSGAVSTASRSGKAEIEDERGGRIYDCTVNRIYSENKAVGMVILVVDITDKAFAERNRREFTANVSHELKTPLQTIIGSAELMENGLVKPEDMPRFIGNIRREASRLVSLTEDIIKLSRLDEGGELPREKTDLHEVAREVIETLSESAARKNVTLRLHGEEADLNGVRGLLHDIVYNLCDNAIRYNREGGSVDITTSVTESGVKLVVADTGIGIPPEYQEKVFERFWRVDKSRSKQSGGTGLGLSIVKHAAEYHGASIDLDSTAGKGTAITVLFPANN